MLRFVLLIISIATLLTACAWWQGKTGNQIGACNELKRQIIANGATGNEQKAIKQRAELDNLNHSYRQTGCD